ncbi:MULTISPECIES: type III secretion system HrpP C-terminal domain-containing protein [unclassified Pseudomonas]|uniref:type III secretion system HrpP C-terminal domain-containing protein n=1 Tax=unclassified Pseudomonas TaxID=196821 RepID=UPI001F453EBD|nr:MULTISPECIES: type III secretion system HrpP C-terminal domain-containing protein [unclassified Pseudomonas]
MNEHWVRPPSPGRHGSANAQAHPPLRGPGPPPAPVSSARVAPRDRPVDSECDAQVSLARSDGYWFRQSVQAVGGGLQQDTPGPGSTCPLAGQEGSVVEAFVDQLTPRLRATPEQQLDMLLHLPHLGRVKVQARRLEAGQGWHIGLGGESAAVQAHLSRRSGQLEDALAEALEQPVSVQVARVEEDD